ncbi:hypothetical protein EDWATA_01696 [Edwardsiella tarda ATCC 23685]|uniref:Uncharacterized protein n=1 Tax=Edwardsiella tarda ATCC 23685 TaxID=500638 RepID=D4F4M3_EDWTA|nr:hypothetical protein EDWATA_01696 [Edwardsiella tarda ATCC 23685]
MVGDNSQPPHRRRGKRCVGIVRGDVRVAVTLTRVILAANAHRRARRRIGLLSPRG